MCPNLGPTFPQADGWFELQTGPWYSSDTATGAGGSVGSTGGSNDVIDASAALDDALGVAIRGGGVNGGPAADAGLDDDSSCLGGFRIPTEEEAFARATNVFSSLVSANPNATWIYQGYPWFRVHSQGASCNQTRLRHFIKVQSDCHDGVGINLARFPMLACRDPAAVRAVPYPVFSANTLLDLSR